MWAQETERQVGHGFESARRFVDEIHVAPRVGDFKMSWWTVFELKIAAHLPQGRVAVMGGRGDDSVFYYRVQSPVLLIEFDHLAGVAFDNDVPTRNHVHSVMRTPNGNDYGMDLLRQHYARAHQPGRSAR